ncbi:MAG: CobD/CbiB family protein [Burkholderiales bacterium]|nr:CobD/CbiB family protein [Burkholderiales bacterium]
MGLTSVIIALLLEQWRPLADRRELFAALSRYCEFLERQLNAGERHQGTVAWMVGVLPPVAIAWLVWFLLLQASPLLALAFNVGALYLTLGFRQSGHHFTGIQSALRVDDLPRAREILARWRGHDCSELDAEALSRLGIEEAFAAAQHQVFGVLFWFMVLPGPSGAILYRLAQFLRQRWSGGEAPESGEFGSFADRAFFALDWAPARLSGLAFAVVGDFEDAVYCWRTQAGSWVDPNIGVVLASGAGALGVKLGMPFRSNGESRFRPELGLGEAADVDALDGAVGLLWRALVLWLALLLLVAVARVFA